MVKIRFVKFTSIDDIKELIKFATAEPNDIALRKGRWVVDAASLMGVFSLDLSSGVNIEYDEPISEEFNRFLTAHEMQ